MYIQQLGKKANTTDEMLDNAVEESLNSGFVSHGDLVVITAGVPVGESWNNKFNENSCCWRYLS